MWLFLVFLSARKKRLLIKYLKNHNSKTKKDTEKQLVSFDSELKVLPILVVFLNI